MAASPVETFTDSVTTQVTSDGPLVVGGIVAIGAIAFGIKALWVAWRAAGKAVGKTGT